MFEDFSMDSPINSLEMSYNDKAATIYRTGALKYTYVCRYCKVLFANISDILDHIEDHFNAAALKNGLQSNFVDWETKPNDGNQVTESTDAEQKCSISSDLCFNCVLCDENFKSQFELTEHLNNHSEYRCQLCEALYYKTSKLLSHLIEMHLKATELICSICAKDFNCKTEYNKHLQRHATTQEVGFVTIIEEVVSKCKPCDDISVQTDVKKCKPRGRNSKLLLCGICQSTFESKYQLSLHIKKKHNVEHVVEKRGVYKCDHCSRDVNGKLLFYAHQYEHLAGANKCDALDDASLLDKLKVFLDASILYDELSPEKAYGCKICSHWSVKLRHNIEKHILQKHICKLKCDQRSEKKYACEYCGHKFRLSHNLMVHKRTHTQEKPYKCRICNKSFSHASYMKYHETVHTGLYTHQCSTCGLSFKSKPKLNIHIKSHSTEMLKCPICSKEFRPHRLNTHIKNVHQNVTRPYKCDVCSQAFKTAKTLKTHSFRHSGEKRYACRFHCNERFISTAGRRGHEKSKHEAHT